MTKRADQQFLSLVADDDWSGALALFEGGKVDPNAQTKQGSNALHLASHQPRPGRRAFLQAMLARGTNPRAFDGAGHLPAHVAIKERDWGAWEFWIDHDPSLINAPDEIGYSPWFMGTVPEGILVHPMTEETFPIWMLRHNVDVSYVEPSGFGRLFYAAGEPQRHQAPDRAMMDLLLQRGAPVITLSNREHKSPLGQVATGGDDVLTARLLDLGEQEARARPEKVSMWEQTLLHTAFVVLHPPTPSRNHPVPQDCWSVTRVQVLEHMSRHHPGLINRPMDTLDPTLPHMTSPEHTVMHRLMWEKSPQANVENLKLMVAHGADITVRDASGKTPGDLAENADNREWLVLMEEVHQVPVEPRQRRRI